MHEIVPSAAREIAVAGVLLPLASVAQAQTETVLLDAGPAPSIDQEADQEVPTIVVTARKLEESENTVGMAITAASGETLKRLGIESVSDLPKLVPGLTVQQSSFNSTSFTLRGVGFFNSDLATPPAVTVYLDEAALSYPAMTKLIAFDVERVEVLKGPQGTLYGQNATGGAINYIAAKPTSETRYGFDVTYGRFERARVGGFVSAPVNDQLGFRLAVQGARGSGWQKSITRPGDRLGRIGEFQGRATLEWMPDAQLTSRATLTVTHDKSDTLAAQFIAPAVQIPPLATPGLISFPVVTTPRSADWTPVRDDTGGRFPYRSDTTLYHLAWRNDYALSPDLTLTSLTSYARFRFAYGQDPDGTPFHVDEIIDDDGKITTFSQELRVSGKAGRLTWLAGANYAYHKIRDEPVEFFRDNDVGRLFQGIDPEAFADRSQFKGRVKVNTYAVFGRLTYQATDELMLEGAVRYNVDRRTFDNCGFALTDNFARFWNLLRGGAPPPTGIGDCYVLDPAKLFQPVDNVHSDLDENSVSWRVGANWTPRNDLLLYANASKGYKAGAVPVLAASTVQQFVPVRQESLLAYEAGVKAGLFKRRAQLNASVFYYEYRDKQLRGATLDPVFGPLEALVSIPKSHVVGAEAQLVARPARGLAIDTSATYVRTNIDRFVGFDALADFGDQSGTPFPFSPKWHSVTHVDYEFPLTNGVNGFAGGSLTYNSKTYAGVGARDIMRIDSYATLDLRAGLEFGRGRYRLWAWGRNVTNSYYWTNVFANGNAIARFPGQPATYGATLSGRF